MPFLTENQEGEQQQGMPMYARQPSMNPDMQQNPDFFLHRINNSDTLEEIKNSLLGIDWVQNSNGMGGKYAPVYEPLVDEKCLRSILFSLNTIGLSKTKSFSRLTTDQINFKCCKFKKSLCKDLAIGYYRGYYNIEKNNLDRIEQSCTDLVHLSLNRCQDGIEAEQLSTASQSINHHVYNDKPQDGESNKGMLQRLFSFGSKG